MTDDILTEQSIQSQTSEFGTGYAYCLGLFLAHEWKMLEWEQTAKRMPPGILGASLWFNGAADHLFGLEIPAALPDEKKKQIEKFRDRCLRFRLCMNGEECTFDDARAACDEAKDLLREWDQFNGIPSVKGEYQ